MISERKDTAALTVSGEENVGNVGTYLVFDDEYRY